MAATTKSNSVPGLLDDMPVDYPAGSHVLTVGRGKNFGTIAAAIAASRDGDVILVDAGTYTNDFATINTKITLIGVGGRVTMAATVPPSNLKGILTVDADATIKNFTFTGSAIPDGDGGNGAGIRYEGGHMVLVNDAFIGNQNGILAAGVIGGLENRIEIDHSLFSGNGSGTGYTHNLYVSGGVTSLVATNSVFENAKVGHELKSRAESNLIENNVFRDGPTGTASYSIDLPNGGASIVRNNVIEKGPQTENNTIVHFGGEGIPYAGSSLLVEANTFINDKDASAAVGVLNQTAIGVSIKDNTFTNMDPTRLLAGPGTLTGNVDSTGAPIQDGTLVGVLPGSTAVFTDAFDHQVVLNNALQAVQGGAGRLTAFAEGGHVIAIGGAGGINFTESSWSGGNQITTAAGSVNTLTLNGQDAIDSHGTDRIKGGAGNLQGQVSGAAVIDGGLNDDRWTVLGTATITGHGGNTFLNVGANGTAAVNGPLHYLGVVNNGGTVNIDAVVTNVRMQASIVGGAAQLQTDGRMNIETAAGSRGALIRMGAGDAQIVSRGKDVIWAGSGSETVIMSGEAELHAGTGALAIFGRGIGGGGAKVYGNGGKYTIDGDSGNITYYGGDKASTVQAKLSNIRLVGGAGRLTVNGGSRETIIGGSGGLTYNSQGGGANFVQTAAGSTNSLVLSDASVIDSWGKDAIFGGAGNQTMTVHGDAVITGSTGNSSITLMGNDVLIGRGQDSVTVARGATATITAGTVTTVRETGAKVTFAVGGSAMGKASVEGGSANITGGTGTKVAVTTDAGYSTKVALLAGSAVVVSQGTDQIYGGTGSSEVVLTAANAEVWAGSGAMVVKVHAGGGVAETVRGGSGKVTLTQGGASTKFIGGSGDAVLDGADGALDVTGGAGSLSITGAELGLRFVGGSGRAAITLGHGANDVTFGSGSTTVASSWGAANTYHFLAGSGGGADVIKGFRVGTDKLDLRGVGVRSQSVSAGSANVVLTDGTRLQLAGVTDTYGLFGSSPAPSAASAPQGSPVTSDAGSAGSGATTPATSTVVVNVSEDAWGGDAQFVIMVDGQQRGGIYTATASHAVGQSQAITIGGIAEGFSPHDIAVSFLNDAWGGPGSSGQDRNLYVDSVQINGRTVGGSTAALYSAGTQHFAASASADWISA